MSARSSRVILIVLALMAPAGCTVRIVESSPAGQVEFRQRPAIVYVPVPAPIEPRWRPRHERPRCKVVTAYGKGWGRVIVRSCKS